MTEGIDKEARERFEAWAESRAWELYCQETTGDMDVRDFWWELPTRIQQLYISRTSERSDEPKK